MPEREPQNNGSNEDPNEPKLSRARAYQIGATGGVLFGVPSYIGATLLGAQNPVEVGGVLTATTAIGIAGSFSKNISLHEAEDAMEEGDKLRMRLKLLQATAENSLISLLPASFIYYLDNIATASLFVAGGTAIGSVEVYREWVKRTKKWPDLIYPQGNSTEHDDSYPDRVNGYKMPPVFTADSIEDMKEFRETNMKKILSWVGRGSLLNIGVTPSPSESVHPLVTSIFILPKIRHYPAMDPEEPHDMKLMDANDYLVASRLRRSDQYWYEETAFEWEGTRVFSKEYWNSWRNRSWNGPVAIVAQYRADTKNSMSFKKPDYERVVDRYWLLDVFIDDDGYRKEEEEKSAVTELVPVFQS